jgi:adenylate cyclase class IV
MPRNIEIKARVEDIEALTAKVTAIADQGPIEIIQDDTFFACDAGRLKGQTPNHRVLSGHYFSQHSADFSVEHDIRNLVHVGRLAVDNRERGAVRLCDHR